MERGSNGQSRANFLLLRENWRLEARLATAEAEASALRTLCRYLQDSAAFVAEKVRLEDVLAATLAKAMGEQADATEALNQMATLAQASADRLSEAESAAADAAEALAEAKTLVTIMDEYRTSHVQTNVSKWRKKLEALLPKL